MNQLSLSFSKSQNEFEEITESNVDQYIDIAFEVEYIADPFNELQGKSILRVVICLDSIAKIPPSKFFPTWCNPRSLDRSSPAFKSMVNTLVVEPKKFQAISEPVRIYSDLVRIEKSSPGRSLMALRFEAPNTEHCGQGVSSGLHRLSAPWHAKARGANLTEARVNTDIWLGFRPELSDLEDSLKSQQSYALDQATKYNFQKKFDELKQVIPKHWKIKYFQGQSGVSEDKRCTINHLIQLLNMLDMQRHNPEKHYIQNAHPRGCAMSVSRNYDTTLSVANKLKHFTVDVVYIERLFLLFIKQSCQSSKKKYGSSIIVPERGKEHHFLSETSLPDSSIIHVKASSSILFPIISSLRAVIDPESLQWKVPIHMLLGRVSEAVIDGDKIISPRLINTKLVNLLWQVANSRYEELANRGVRSPFVTMLTDVQYWQDLYTLVKRYLMENFPN